MNRCKINAFRITKSYLIVFRAFTVIDLDLFGYAVLYIGFIEDGIALVSLVGEYRLYGGVCPSVLSCRRFEAFFFKPCDDLSEAVTADKLFVYKLDDYRFFGDDFGFAVCTSAVAEEILVVEWHIIFLCTLSLAPFHIGTYVFGFALCDAAVYGSWIS